MYLPTVFSSQISKLFEVRWLAGVPAVPTIFALVPCLLVKEIHMKYVDCDHLSLTHLHLIAHTTSVTNKMTETDRVKKPAAVEYTRIVMSQAPAV